MTTRHGDPACGTRHCFACNIERTDGLARRWFDAGVWLDEPPGTTDTRFTAAVLATLDLDDHHDQKGTT